ncbi:polynucleotide 5'-hydroxyl-kinase [Aureococcus anophagefferens]|nr:polynucleotide 5'-hydroxyl-kinase [Aureococcus anophagefferens]
MGPARIGDLRLYLGDRHDAKDRSLLRSLKINAVLNCTPPRDESSTGCPNFFEKEPAMRYRRVPIFDTQAEDAGPFRRARRPSHAPPAAPNDAFLAQLRALEARLDAARATDAKRTGAAPAPAPALRAARPIGRARGPSAQRRPLPERAAPAAPARPERAVPAAPARPERADHAPARPSAIAAPAARAGAAAAIGPAAGPPPGRSAAIGPARPGPEKRLSPVRRRRAVEVAERTSERLLGRLGDLARAPLA